MVWFFGGPGNRSLNKSQRIGKPEGAGFMWIRMLLGKVLSRNCDHLWLFLLAACGVDSLGLQAQWTSCRTGWDGLGRVGSWFRVFFILFRGTDNLDDQTELGRTLPVVLCIAHMSYMSIALQRAWWTFALPILPLVALYVSQDGSNDLEHVSVWSLWIMCLFKTISSELFTAS